MAKDLGTELEQLLVDELWRYRYEEIRPGPAADRFHEFLDINRLRSPVFTTAGGTNEVLRLLVGRQLPGWASTRKSWALRSPLAEAVFEQAVSGRQIGRQRPRRRAWAGTRCRAARPTRCPSGCLARCAPSGFLGVSVPEDLGGSGGSLNDALDVIRGAAYAGVSTPVIEGPVLAGWLLRQVRARLSLGRRPGRARRGRRRARGDGPQARFSPASLSQSPGRAARVCWWCRSTGTGSCSWRPLPPKRSGPRLAVRTPRASPWPAVSGSTARPSPRSRRPACRLRGGRRDAGPAAGPGARGGDDRRAAAGGRADHRLRGAAGSVRAADRPVPGGADPPGQAGIGGAAGGRGGGRRPGRPGRRR